MKQKGIFMSMDYTKINEWLKNNLNEERYLHTLGTADCAKELALKFGQDMHKAYLAGLLHDCAKCFPTEKLLSIIETDKLDVENSEKENYKTLHAPVSAHLAKTLFGIDDEEIISAIRWHTLGKLEMTDFEKIIFIADKIEPNTRSAAYSAIIWNLLNENDGINKALLRCYKETIKSLVDRDLKICLLTVEIYNKLEHTIQK